MPITEGAIVPGFTRDLYVSLGDSVSTTAWIVRVQHKPFVDWIWGGCLLMALGGALAASDRRYRLATRQQQPYAVARAAPYSRRRNSSSHYSLRAPPGTVPCDRRFARVRYDSQSVQ